VVVENGRELCKAGYRLPATLVPGIGAAQDFAVASCLAAGEELLAIPDLQRDPRLSGSPLSSAGRARALAAVPLSTPFSEFPAYVAVLDFQVHPWSPRELQLLREARPCFLQELEAAWLREEVERQQQAARRERRAKVTLLAGIPYGFFLLDNQGRCLLMNPEAARFFQDVSKRAPEELIGKDLWQACPEVADSSFAREYRRAQAEERDFLLETYIPGRQHWFEFQGRRAPEGLYVTFRDVNEQTQRERSLRSAEQLAALDPGREDFLLQLAHEFRNALAPIRTALHLGRTQDTGAPELRQANELAEREVQDMCRLLDDLLKVALLPHALAPPKLATVDVVALVTGALRALLASPRYRGHSLDLRLPPEALYVAGDAAMLERALVHLLENAAKFTASGGQIGIEARREGASILLRIWDDGVGIAPEKLPRLFDLFMRAERSDGRLRGGVGIGLPLVQRLVALHGGEVTAFSDGAGQGSTFVVRLRAITIPDTPTAPSDATDPPKPARILVIDHCTEAAQSIALLLQAWGYEVHVAYDPAVALELAQTQPPQVVLLELDMPQMDGYEVARRLRQREESKNAVLVAVTGYGEQEDQQQVREVGFDYHMIKPVDPEGLRQLLDQGGFHGTHQSSVA
jgi:signal transduction histidine kinase/ActR/RegA family two-component response regulator